VRRNGHKKEKKSCSLQKEPDRGSSQEGIKFKVGGQGLGGKGKAGRKEVIQNA